MSENLKVKMSLEHLTKVFANGDGVRDIELTIYESEILTLLGPSGCGKTTILRMIGGFLTPDSGRIVLDGVDVARIPPEKRPTTMVFQSYTLWPHMTVFDNLAFGLRLRKKRKEQIRAEVEAILDMVNMSEVGKKYPAQLSGGQQQRVAIARALLLKPAVLLMDEPFSALDAKIRLQMREELKKLQRELNITIVFVTHDQEEAMSISSRIAVMHKGIIEQIGTAKDIYDCPASRFVAHFIGNMNFIEVQAGSVLAVRPEDISLYPSGEGGLEGVITFVTILGHYLEVHIETARGNVKMFSPRGTVPYRPGDAVGLRFSNERVFRLEESVCAG
ncbi:MAG: ABC transporter ATP-binding protein [Clostridiales Family XIII bacterium]|jgi:putative spermidine/putrescine transport system ATP-binding protein|nr:ABC transporter ATP-binding protein [Clostridiales Family XIII bacterium]